MDYRSRRDLEKLLGGLDVDREDDVRKGRSERIRQASHVSQFERALEGVLRPALRDVMGRLERYGHVARLLTPRPTLLRIEIVLQAAKPIHGRIEIQLDPVSGAVWFRSERQHVATGELALPVEELSESRVAAALVQVLRGITEAPVPSRGRRP